MAYLLDTDIIIYHLNGNPHATALVHTLFNEGVATSAVTYMEALEGTVDTDLLAPERQRFETLVGNSDSFILIP